MKTVFFDVGSVLVRCVHHPVDYIAQRLWVDTTVAHNVVSQKMMAKTGFTKDCEPYNDADGLTWQNFAKTI